MKGLGISKDEEQRLYSMKTFVVGAARPRIQRLAVQEEKEIVGQFGNLSNTVPVHSALVQEKNSVTRKVIRQTAVSAQQTQSKTTSVSSPVMVPRKNQPTGKKKK